MKEGHAYFVEQSKLCAADAEEARDFSDSLDLLS